jgi:hypothetical protein
LQREAALVPSIGWGKHIMLKGLVSAVAGGLLAGCAALAVPAQAQSQSSIPNVLVMGEDCDQDTVPRNSRVFRQVLQEMQQQLDTGGYRYFDETTVGLGEMVENRTRRCRAELVDVARLVTREHPIDVVALFSIYASTQQREYASIARIRVEGELLDPHSGQGFGTFEMPADEVMLPLECPRECLLEKLGERSRNLGRDLGHVLVQLLDQRWERGPATAERTSPGDTPSAPMASGDAAGFVRTYDLCFDGFTQDDVVEIEEVLVAFQGYQSHRARETQATRTCFAYESGIAQAKLSRNLVRMLGYLDMEGTSTCQGTACTISKVPQRKRHPLDDPKTW